MGKLVGMLIGLLLVATPAHAEFTDAEKEQVAKLVEATRMLSNALRALAVLIRDDTGSEAVLKNAVSHTRSAVYSLHYAMAYLMNQGGQTFSEPVPADRARKLAAAWFHLDRAEMFVGHALDVLETVVDSSAKSAARSSLSRSGHFAGSFDRSLAYALPGGGRVVGPHGDFDLGQWNLQRAWVYALQFMDWIFKDYPAGTNSDWVAVAQYTPSLFNTFAHAMAVLANVDTSQNDVLLRSQLALLPGGEVGVRFWFVLRLGESLSSARVSNGGLGVPAVYHTLQASFPACASSNCAQARVKLTDSWKHSDSALWWILGAFPDCNVQTDPMGCAIQLPSQRR